MTIGPIESTIIGSSVVSSTVSSTSGSREIQPGLITSPQLVAARARIRGEWKDLVYREALRMTSALRQILSQGNNNANRSQLVNKRNVLIILIIYFV